MVMIDHMSGEWSKWRMLLSEVEKAGDSQITRVEVIKVAVDGFSGAELAADLW